MTRGPEEGGGRRQAKDSLRLLGGPLLAYFDKRFQEVNDRVEDRITELYARVATDVETMSEMTLVMQRFVDVAGDQVDDVVGRMTELCDLLDRRQTTPDPIQSAFATAAVARRPAGSRVLLVATGSDHDDLAGALSALGYDVSLLDVLDGPEEPFDCALWLTGQPDQHTVDLVGKSLGPGGELVLSVRSSHGAGSLVEDHLRDWSVLEHRVVEQPAGGPGGAVVELLRATPRT
jgi:hypothetical protein